jgi:CelD/BcsL family acetyltransferase involved in cellulose biosynthesis
MTITRASLGSGWLARERADNPPRRVFAGRAEWQALSALIVVRAEWRDLAARALEPNVFYDPAFALAAAPVFGADAGAVLVWSKADARRLIGLFPLRAEQRYGVIAALTGWTHPYAPFGVPLVDRDEAEAAIGAFLDHVGSDPKLPKLVLLPLIARDGAFAATLAGVLARHKGEVAHFGDHARAMLAPAGGRAAYLDHALTHKKLKELRRQRRRLDEVAPIKLETAREPAAVSSALVDFFALESGGWKGRAGTAAAHDATVRGFIQHAIPDLAVLGHARVDRLTQSGRPLAVTITLRSGACAWFWKIAHDEAFARASPGVQVSLDLTEQLIADQSLAQADSCATAGHPMIDHLWRERLALTDLLIAPGPAALGAFRIARHLETLRRALLATAKRVRDALR